ncbi:hypothetical protein [Nonomuraea dietziae]|uniref:hypothetical protein n=1 Tax=Nonomuraea dietziae TaxID=65515 RepID=UPI00342D4D18
MSRRTVLHVAGDSPKQRGHDRGRQARDGIARTWRVHGDLFTTVAAAGGVTLDVPALALRTVATARAWGAGLARIGPRRGRP